MSPRTADPGGAHTDRGTPSSSASGGGAGGCARGGFEPIVHEDDRQEEISQPDAETVKKVTINEASTLLSVVTTLTRRLVKRNPW